MVVAKSMFVKGLPMLADAESGRIDGAKVLIKMAISD